jgi:hypothetical protein
MCVAAMLLAFFSLGGSFEIAYADAPDVSPALKTPARERHIQVVERVEL